MTGSDGRTAPWEVERWRGGEVARWRGGEVGGEVEEEAEGSGRLANVRGD